MEKGTKYYIVIAFAVTFLYFAMHEIRMPRLFPAHIEYSLFVVLFLLFGIFYLRWIRIFYGQFPSLAYLVSFKQTKFLLTALMMIIGLLLFYIKEPPIIIYLLLPLMYLIIIAATIYIAFVLYTRVKEWRKN